MKIRLSAPDRERLGCPEWLDFDLTNLSLHEAEALEEAGGNYEDFFAEGPKAIRSRVWVALHRAGVTVAPYGSLTFNLVFETDGAPGKAPSAEGERTTPSTSATSSRPSRRKRSSA